MNISTNFNSIYTQNTTANSQVKESQEKYDDKAIPKIEDLLDEGGMEVLNGLLDGMSLSEDEEQGIKLALGYSLSIKSNNVVDGKLQIEREDSQLDFQTASNKLLRIAREKGQGGFLSQEIKDIANELMSYYSGKIQESLNVNNLKDSQVDELLKNLQSTGSIESKSNLIKNDIKNKLDSFKNTLNENMTEREKHQILTDYKQELFKGYKEVLDNIKEETPSLQGEGLIKALLDENSKEVGALENLLSVSKV